MVRALASHQCGPGSIPRSGVKCGLSLLALFSGYSGFPSPQKPKFDLIELIVNLSYSAVSLISAPALEETRHLIKFLTFSLPLHVETVSSYEGLKLETSASLSNRKVAAKG